MLLEKLRRDIVDLGNRMVADRVAHDGQGNISAIDRSRGLIAITPSAIPYAQRSAEDICVVDLDGKPVAGRWKPTSEMALHLVFYRRRDDVQAVVHTHPPYTSVFAVIGETEMPMVLIESALALGASLPIAPYARPGTEEVARLTCEVTGDGVGAVMAHHGLVTVGEDLAKAYAATLAAEGTARTLILARSMGALPISLPDDEIKALRETYLRHYKPRAVDPGIGEVEG